jgi:CBS-domain-containing membrane protein
MRMRRRSKAPARSRAYPLIVATVSSVAALALLVFVGMSLNIMLFIPPLAASMALVAGAPMLPLAQPRNVIGGQLISGAVGLGTFWVAGGTMWAAAVAGGLALGAMLLTRTSHSPAAATAAIAAFSGPPPAMFMLFLLLATIVLVLVGIVGAQLSKAGRYPKYWW